MRIVKKLMNMIYNFFDRLFSSKKEKSGDSRLMSMYLSQTNAPKAFISEHEETRQRQNSKSVQRDSG